MRPSFRELVENRWLQDRHVCVGLDVDLGKLPEHLRGSDADRCSVFVREIVAATADVAAAYKPNTAFFEALGAAGPQTLQTCIKHIHELAPGVPVIVDAKRADIANTNSGSATYLFEYLQADAITVHPYLGHEAIRPFLEHRDRGIFVLCRTSNPGAREIQDLEVGGEPLYLHLAELVRSAWNTHGNCGLVVGATYPDELASIRARVGELPLLIPGVGAQGGDLEATIRASWMPNGLHVLINASRSVIYASSGSDFGDAAGAAATDLNDAIVGVPRNLG